MPNMRRYITLLILSAATLLQAQTVKSVRLVEDAAGNDRHAPSYEVTYEMHIPQPRTDYSYILLSAKTQNLLYTHTHTHVSLEK